MLRIDPPSIETRNGNGWAANGTGAELLSDFVPENGALPNARIGRISPQASCDANSPTSNFDFGASFASIFNPTHTGDLHPVVPTMRGGGQNCNDEPRSFVIDGREVSLWEVLAFPNDVSPTLGEFASVVAAAYFNALAYPHYPVAKGQIVHMWNDGVSGGYCPSSGCTDGHVWDMNRIMQYLKSTFETPD